MSSDANDIRVLCSLPDHPKTKKLIRRLGPGAGWFLIRLWLWSRDNRPSGDLTGMTAEDIELAIDWNGENDAFVSELVSVRLLDGGEGTYRLHDWADHNPWSAGSDQRSLKAKWNAVKRHHGAREADRQVPEYAAIRATSKENDATSTKSNAGSTDAAMHVARRSNATSGKSDAPSPSPSPSPSEELFTPADAGVVAGKPPTPLPSVPDCPHSEIVAAYHEVLPELARVREWTPDRQAFLRARWREKPERQSVEWWRKFFGYVRTCPFLMGQGASGPDRDPFYADLEWLIRPKNFRKVIEGKYQRRVA